MESKDKQSSSNSQYEPALGYVLEDIRPDGGVVKFRSPAYSNVSQQDTASYALQLPPRNMQGFAADCGFAGVASLHSCKSCS